MDMKINITKEQYWHLMRATYMADWMANAICEDGMKEDKGIEDIREYVFSFAKDFGYEDYVKYDKDLKEHFSTWDLDDEPSTRALIERYDEHTFWEEMTERFAIRDFYKKYSEKEIKSMNRDELYSARIECEEKWGIEFEKYGIDRLEIDK